MKSYIVCILLLVCLQTIHAVSYPKWVDPLVSYHHRRGTSFAANADNTTLCYQPSSTVVFNCTVNYFTQKIDHFSFLTSETYLQKYLVYDGFVNGVKNPPIFFYSGNEGPIELFAQNSGLLWDLAPSFNALLIFAEHRYYGNGSSYPFGVDKAFSSPETIQFLSVEQALADYAVLLTELNQNHSSSVITFGGSYGGMLSAWFRMKYPSVVDGAIACSAPIYQFDGLTDPHTFSHIATVDFYNANNACAQTIFDSWNVFTNLSKTAEGLAMINKYFPNCGPKFNSTADVQNNLFPFLSSTYSYMAMADYPYPANFIGNLPGNPIDYVCANISASTNPEVIVSNIASIAKVFWSYQTNFTCFEISSSEPSSLGAPTAWNYQSCTEMYLPVGQYQTGANSDMFYYAPWDVNAQLAMCAQPFNSSASSFGVVGNPQWIPELFGGKNIAAASRIVFSNGDLDPWSGGGVLETVSPSLVALNVTGGAHHLDLRGANPADPPGVKWVRQQEKAYITAWLNGYNDPQDMSATSDLATKWVVLISVGSTLATVIIALALFKWCRSRKKPESTSTYEAM